MKQTISLLLLFSTFYVDIKQLTKEHCVIIIQKENSSVEHRALVKCDEIDKKDYSQWIKEIVKE